ncbi:MAG: hypothetical protein WEB52_12770 [Dehalococcoidia bacterium]
MSIEQATAVSTTAAPDGLLAASGELLRKHVAGISLALLLAALLVAPRWWTFVSDPDDGARVSISPYAAGAVGYDEALYAASIRDAFEGEVPIRDPFLVNHRDGSPQRSSIPHTVIGAAGRVTGGPFASLAIATTVAALAALVLLYALMLGITGSRFAALVLMPIVILAVHVLNFADGILPLRHAEVLGALVTVDPEDQVHAWARFPAPILVLAPFFAAVLALPKAVAAGSRGWMATAATAIALLIYTYLYYWAALGLALAAWLAVLMLRGERAEAGRLLAIGGLALVIALPEIVVIGWAGVSLPADVRDRVGLDPIGLDTSLASSIAQRLLVGLPLLIALMLRATSRSMLYVLLFLAPLVLAPVQGVLPQQWHFETQVWGVFAIPAFVAGGVAIASSLRWSQPPRFAYAGIVVVALASLVYVGALQARAVSSTADGYVLSDDEQAAFAWMRAHVDEDDTVVSPSVSTNLLLAGLTSSAQYLADGGFTYAEDDELGERILRVQAAYGYSEGEVMRRVSLDGEFEGFPLNDPDPDVEAQERLLEDHLAFFIFSFEITDRGAFEARAESWRGRYRTLLSTNDVLDRYPAEYLYCGHRERFYGASAPAEGTLVRVAFERGDVRVYERVDVDSADVMAFPGCSA